MSRVLVVEDSHTQALALSAILEVSNFEVARVSRLSEALEKLKDHVDIILLDLTLPDSSGLDTVIRMHQASPQVPIVVLTGLDDEALAVKALHEGAQDYLVKGQMDGNLLVRSMRYAIERKRADEQVRALNQKLAERVAELEETQEKLIHAERMKALGVLAAGFAHELNNPMMGIINQVQYALAKLPEDSRAYQVLTEALGHTRRCVRIVQDLLTYSRKDAVGPKGEHASGNMNTALRLALQATEDAMQNAGVRVITHFARDLPPVALDESHLQQVFVNLILNARDAMTSAARRELVLETLAEEGAVRMTARDTGIGMDALTLSRIFEPFYTTKPPGSGTGLGLSLCKNLVESVGGRIEAESAPGRGTTFTVVVPLAKDARGGKPMKRILVIDDDAAVRSAFELALEDTPYEVVVAGGGEEGLAKLQENKFDLIYLDLKMPGIDGIETLRRLRRNGSQVPVRIVTAFAEEFMRPLEAALNEGLEFEVVRKPLGREGIRTVTASVLGDA